MGDCERPCFDQLKAHILLFCWRSMICVRAANQNMDAYTHPCKKRFQIFFVVVVVKAIEYFFWFYKNAINQ